ncbi:Mutator MutT protein (7,8-dihydro-8-oxoguanine-triphosphatase) / Thiazole tautomerase TenI-like domain [hydrothermal vent metagenome]|uniref:8-oxo-dGTP diphosphatase n=1 Tax=hydrothermal vent metagenome TaxID=652676 RepID=A0A3B0Z9P3_9ZZZZ
MGKKSVIQVAVGVIRNDQGELLITQRHGHQHQGGCWEFPGGKIELNELVEQALQRELREELAIEVVQAEPLIMIPFEYPEYHVVLNVWQVMQFSGDPAGQEGQPVAWVSEAQLVEFTFPEANRAIISAIQLPSRYMITGKPADEPERFLQKLESALVQGIKLVQLRAKGLDDDAFLQLAKRALSLCHQYGAKLLLNGDPSLLEVLPEADGIQLSSHHSTAFDNRPIALDKLLGVSCHTREQLDQAVRINADFALLSPVQATATHPDDKPLGWSRFSSLVADVPIPVYALGGMDASLENKARQHGGQGIAAISALWNAQSQS